MTAKNKAMDVSEPKITEQYLIDKDQPSELEMVGSRIRELRNGKNLTLKTLSEISKLNINTLSMIETGRTSPSIYTLQQLAKAMRVPLVDFFTAPEKESAVVFIQSNQRPESMCCQALIQNLGGGMRKSTLEPFIVTLSQDSSSGGRNLLHRGYEFVFCLKGKVTYWVQDTEYLLNEGDSLLFAAEKTHRWANAANGESQFLLILTPDLELLNLSSVHFQNH